MLSVGNDGEGRDALPFDPIAERFRLAPGPKRSLSDSFAGDGVLAHVHEEVAELRLGLTDPLDEPPVVRKAQLRESPPFEPPDAQDQARRETLAEEADPEVLSRLPPREDEDRIRAHPAMIAWSGMKGGLQKIAALASYAPFVMRVFLASSRPRRFLVLCYHRVNDDGHSVFPGTPLALFRRQMEALRRNFAVLPLQELWEKSRRGDLPENGVAITFDDGYRDNYENAFPILRELGLPATIFLTTDALDRGDLIWHDRVFDAFHRTRKADARASLAAELARLRRTSPGERDRRIEELLLELGIEPGAPRGWEKLTWQQVREMSRGGISFGAHTLDHPILTFVSEEEARRQIRDSKERIEKELGSKVTMFAYPNGGASDFNRSTERMVEEEGFSLAVTTVAGANDESTNPFALHRTGMWGSDPRLSVLRLALTRIS